jgi:nucleotide-binding universal stress UspA family protein
VLPIHTILHPTDFSDHSAVAFRMACALARDYDARLVVLHVTGLPAIAFVEGVVPPQPEDYFAAAEAELRRVRPPDARIRVEHRLKEGDPVTEILEAAREAGADLIVMGTHGRTGLGRFLMGSVAEHVVRHATCPVVTVRTPFPVDEPASEALAGTARGA